MIAQDIIVTFWIFNLLNYDNIFGKKLEHDTFEIYVRFLFFGHI